MKTEVLTVASKFDANPLSILIAVPEEQSPRALVQFAHGMCEHKERYLPFIGYLTQHGFACAINDHRGHGASVRSSVELGWFGAKNKGAEGLLQDMHQVSALLKERFPGLPLILFGHSMGSMAVRCYARRWDDELSGLLVCGSPGENPAVGAGLALTRVLSLFGGQRRRSGLLNKILFGTFNRDFESEGLNAWLARDRAVAEAYNADPLCGFVFTVNGYESLFKLMVECYSTEGWKAANPGMPVHFVSGGNDPCRVSDDAFYAAGEHMRLRGYRCVTQKLYTGLRHEILNEGEMQVWQEIEEVLSGWVSAARA